MPDMCDVLMMCLSLKMRVWEMDCRRYEGIGSRGQVVDLLERMSLETSDSEIEVNEKNAAM